MNGPTLVSPAAGASALPRVAGARDPRTAALEAAVARMPLFAGLDAAERALVASRLRSETVPLGRTIASEGEPVGRFVCIHSGAVRLKRRVQGVVRSMGRRPAGTCFGEAGFYEPVAWGHTIAAAEPDTVVLSLDMGGPDPELQPVLEKLRPVAARLALERELEPIADRAEVDPEWCAALAEQVRVCRFDAGEEVYAQGAADTSLYYVLRGRVSIVREGIEEALAVGTAEPGDYLGEHGALGGSAQAYRAVASESSTLVEIPAEALPLVYAMNPGLRERLAASVRSYEEEAVRLRDSEAHRGERGNEYPEFEEAARGKRIRRFPFLRQHEETDCGAACLTMISEYYGLHLSMGRVRELANVSVAGASMAAVSRAAENLGYRARALKLTYPALRNLKLPAIVHWEGYHWIVLYALDRRHAWVADPDRGLRKLTHAEFAAGWTGYAIELEPTAALQEVKQDGSPIWLFARYLLPYRRYYGEIFLAAIVLNLLGLASPLFLQAIVDSVVVYKDVGLLNLMLVGMVLVAFFGTLTSSLQSLLAANVSAKLDLRMLADFYRHVLSLPPGFFYSHRIADILSRFGENSRIRDLLAGTTITTVLNVFMIVVYLGLMFAYNTSMTLLVLAFVPLFVAQSVIFAPMFRRLSNELFRSGNEQSGLMIESIQGIETVKSTAAEWHVRSRWENRWVENVNLGFRMQRLGLVAGVSSSTINTLSTVAILWYGAHQVIADAMSVGELMAFNALVGSVMGPILGLVGLWQAFSSVRVSMERVNDILIVQPEQPIGLAARAAKVELPYCKGRIEFRDVEFRYGSEDSPLVIQGASLVIEPGQTVAFVGKSGCGKSTLMKMVAGFNIPTGGALLVDGYETSRLDLQSLRRHVGWVLQDSFLFNATVVENIAFGDPNPDMERVREAAELAAADEFIREFAKGYDTVIGDKGLMVSGGQRQRICIARALYRRPQILLFDEATSALDAQSEKRIQENLQGILGQGRTAIIIAHRLSTIRHADVIYYLDHGVVMEQGTHDELMARRGRYHAMASQQLGGDA